MAIVAVPSQKIRCTTPTLALLHQSVQFCTRIVEARDPVDILVQSRRNKAAGAVWAKKFFRKLLKGYTYVPRVLITDKLARSASAHKDVMPSVEQRKDTRVNSRAANSRQPTRHRERTMGGFKSAGHAQRFLSAFRPIREHFCTQRVPGCHRLRAEAYRREHARRFQVGSEVSRLRMAA